MNSREQHSNDVGYLSRIKTPEIKKNEFDTEE